MPKLSDSQIREVVERIFDNFEPEKVIVFGSQVTGDTDKSSDLDLMVVIDPGERTCRDVSVEIHRKMKGLKFGIDIIVMKPDEFERYSSHPATMTNRALEEGCTVYEEPVKE